VKDPLGISEGGIVTSEERKDREEIEYAREGAGSRTGKDEEGPERGKGKNLRSKERSSAVRENGTNREV